ncbi:MAG: hypothetical protein QM708_12480 [Propioniciclava sp.]|uniref:hypothetical protein n=1 Tax=Propioniciclava sp. TaxID=2038686 RepID=UPI0039E2A628
MRGRRKVWAHVALIVIGVGALVWALTAGTPQISCRDATMGPGDICVNAQGTKQQTYEERLAAHRSARPVVGGVGVVLAAFGGVLVAGELRAAGSSDRARPGRRP